MAYATLVLGLLWSRHVETPYLVVELLTWVAACVLLIRARLSRMISIPLVAAVLVLGVSIVAQSYAAWRIDRIGEHWTEIVAERTANMREILDGRVGEVIADAQRVAPAAARGAGTADTIRIFNTLADLHQRSKVDAIALFGEAGELIAWTGEHRAQLPQDIRVGATRPQFVEQPLYSYLYIPQPVPGSNRRIVIAVMLATSIHEHAHDVSDRSLAHVTSHLGVRFRTGKGEPEAWPLVVDGDTIAHARLTPITQSEYRAQAIETAQRVACILAIIALLLLAAAWLRRPTVRLGSVVPLLAAAAALACAPLRAFGLDALFSPGLFLLPIPADVSLGTLLAILLALAALAASARGLVRIPRWPTLLLVLGALAITFGYPGAIRLLVGPGGGAGDDSVRAAGSDLLLGGPALWFGLQVAAVLMLAILTELGLPRWNLSSPRQSAARLRSPWGLALVGAFMTSGALSVLVLMLGQTRQWVSPWFAAAWALPFTLAALGLVGYGGNGIRLIRWITAGWLSASAVLPYVWIAHVDARLSAADRELSTLGSVPDPYLDYLLMQFAREGKVRAEAGETGYLLLYRSWVSSGLARENYPARLTIWTREGLPEVQLPLGNLEESTERSLTVPTYLGAALMRVRENPDSVELMRVQGVPAVNEALIMALDSGRILTIEVPPRRSLEHRDIPFIASNAPQDTHVELVRPRPGVVRQQAWVPTDAGWRSEKPVHFADGEYHAHMEVRVAPLGVRIARGVLLLAFDLGVFVLLWLLGRAARGERLRLRAVWDDWRGSFRVRVTATLFFFFLIPTTVFGWVAFGALAREVTRATRIVAERAVRQAVLEFQESPGDLPELASHAGADVLYYFDGELDSASSPEAVDLGVYGAWMPPGIYYALTRGDEDAAVATRRIAGQQVLTAYRALIPAGILAVPMSLESGETAVRQRELAHLILFAALMGGMLSLMLSVVVGRALTGPIGRLQRAAAQVGAGNLRVRMPEHTGDEFGQLFETFNRMVRRLRRARKREVQTARVLAWGEMARQVAHEIKNPLTPIKLAVQHIKRTYADRNPNFGDVLDENVDQILLEIDRLSEISRAFSRYGAPGASTGPLEPVNVQQVVHEALTLYRVGDPDVVYREEIQPDVPRALGRSGELKEVLINLLENARAALDGSGEICIAAHETENGVEIVVTDNGPGIPADFLSRVFEPHFSTRSAGTGLGLAIVRRLVESWGGAVTAESEPDAGTTIRVTLRQVITFP